MKTINWVLAAVFVAGLASNIARAETKLEEPKPTQQSPSQSGQLTFDSLKEMLDLLGYDFTVEKLADGNVLYYVKMIRKGVAYAVNVNISSSKTKLWTTVALADWEPPHTARADRLLKLLELNQKIGPSSFYYYPPHKMIYLNKSMDNRDVTAKLLRQHIDDLMEQIVANEEHWNPKKWTPAVAANTIEK